MDNAPENDNGSHIESAAQQMATILLAIFDEQAKVRRGRQRNKDKQKPPEPQQN